jgi:hypothetical protein
MGCGAAFQLQKLSIGGDLTDVPQMTIEVCRNKECLTGSFGQARYPDSNDSATVTFPDPSTIEETKSAHVDAFIVEGAATTPGLQLSVDYYPYNFNGLEDGDVYGVTVRRGSTVVGSFEKTVTYRVSYPNGVACGPECRNAI